MEQSRRRVLDRVTRRRLIQGSAALASGASTLAAGEPFTASAVRRAAQDLAKQPFREPCTKLPGAVASMIYDQYRGIRFKPDRALWRGQDLPFQISFLGTIRMSGVPASAANEAVSTANLVRFGGRITRPAYRQSLLAVSGTPDILMVSLAVARHLANAAVQLDIGLPDVSDVVLLRGYGLGGSGRQTSSTMAPSKKAYKRLLRNRNRLDEIWLHCVRRHLTIAAVDARQIVGIFHRREQLNLRTGHRFTFLDRRAIQFCRSGLGVSGGGVT